MISSSSSPSMSSRGGAKSSSGSDGTGSVWVRVLIVMFSLQTLFIWSTQSRELLRGYRGVDTAGAASAVATTTGDVVGVVPDSHISSSSSSAAYFWDRANPLGVPQGEPPNLPSVRQEEDNEVDKKRKIYGGKGDGKHLGGFTEYDSDGVSPAVWSKMITELGVRSFMDVGCGRGISTRWFHEHGAKVLCVEGSHDAVTQTFLPPENVVEHDFSRGPWWPRDTYDAVWSVEFLEHVSRQYHFNYMSTYRKAAILFLTSSRWGGWHHVEIHPDDWWIRKVESYGFRYDAELSEKVKQWNNRRKDNYKGPDGETPKGTHISQSMKVFINPAVAALPQHAHLFPRDGCFDKPAGKEGEFYALTRPCGVHKTQGQMETPLPDSFLPLNITMEMHENWIKIIRQGMPSLLEKQQQ